jgi:cysteinyl-tRNA synthetase
MALKLYNSLTRKKEEFKPLKKGKVGIYVCGPTVYGHAHLGHAKSYVSFDILVRYLRYLGNDVKYVQNITDVGHLLGDTNEGEDRMLVAAAREHKHPMAVAEFYTRNFFEDMDALNCVRPDISPRATGHIVEQIELVKKLLDKGFAYEANGSVYFDISKFEDYGKLSGRNIEEMQAGVRVEVSPNKKHPADFALWKKAEPNHIMQWPSPWGMGFPGWHLECSVMSTKYLGQPFDIHGGGLDNKFPHHECEIAQAEAAEGKQFVKYWVHNNMVTVDGQKMSKSLNNFITLKQAFSPDEPKHDRLSRKYDPLAIRQLILNSHYRSPLDFSDAALTAAQSGYEKVVNAAKDAFRQSLIASAGRPDEKVMRSLDQLKIKFEDAMNDDLNTAIGLSVIFELVSLTKSLLETKNTNRETFGAVYELFRKLGGDVLGIVLGFRGEWTSLTDVRDTDRCITAHAVMGIAESDKMRQDLIDNLLRERKRLRQEKDFKTADILRNILQQSGITVADEKDGTSRGVEK